MWTPRRILILLATLFGFGVVYAGYARFLGRIDGLPKLPDDMIDSDINPLPILQVLESPTIARLKEAFGENCAEIGAAYPTRLEIREQGVVFAAGMPQIGSEPTRFVRLSPLSVALFAKPKPVHEQVPGEVTETSTLHSDEGILEFDKPVASDRDMISGKAKLIGVEMRSNPDPHSTDPRNSRIVITNNQRSADPGQFLVVHTPGPVFYRTANHPDAFAPNQPQISTMASVEIVNRENLPRPLRGAALPVVAMPSDDALVGTVVADMALGLHTAPPTITADGMKIFMKRAEAEPAKNGVKGKDGGGYAGMRELIFNENVLFSLWTDSGSGFPGSDAKPPEKAPEKPAEKAPVGDPPLAIPALLGGLHDGHLVSERLKSKALLRIRTLGPFHYDLAANTARFDVAPQANPLLPNNVEAMRYLPLGGKDTLICQRLDIEFNGPVAGKPETAKSRDAGPGFKKLLATGTYVMMAAATEQLQAQGTLLLYETDAKKHTTTTTLRGAPLSAIRGRNILTAGDANRESELVLASIEPPPGSKQEKRTDVNVNGPGSVVMYDEATGEKNMTANWKKSLTQTREVVGGMPLDLLTFTEDGEFIDAKGLFDLKGDVLKLWLKSGEKSAAGSSKSVPHRLESHGHVTSVSEDAIVENTDHLTMMFTDVPKPAVAAAPPPVLAREPAPVGNAPPAKLEPVAQAPPPPKKPNPVHLAARLIETSIHRFSDPDPKAAAKYELQEAHCTDRVVVVQASADLKKAPIGMDIRSAVLHVKKRGTGHEMTAIGDVLSIARVRFENTTICGPTVVIDQPNNSVNVAGSGWMRMPSSSSMSGGDVAEPAEITVHWQTRMKFLGERRWAEFVGQVQAVQAPTEGMPLAGDTISKSSVACHEMNVTFDKPVYFNQMKREPRDPKSTESDPKIESVICTPASEDGDAIERASGRTVLYLDETFDAKTKKPVKAQQIESKLLEVHMKDNVSLIDATGPGITRMLQMGSKDNAPGAKPAAAAVPTANGKTGTVGPRIQPVATTLRPAPAPASKDDQEMKLTVVHFNGRLAITDQKGIFQKAVFRDNVRVAQVPSDNLHLVVDELAPAPERSLFLKCNDTFTVTSYKSKTPGGEDTNEMEAVDGAQVKTDDYIGQGHTIRYDGTNFVLRGFGDGQATLYRIQAAGIENRDFKSGNPLVYNVKTKQVSGDRSSGGQFSSPK